MSNTQQINLAVTSAIKMIVIILCILVVGMALPMISSIMLSLIINQVKFQDCVTSVPFWIFTFISTVSFAIYIASKIEEANK